MDIDNILSRLHIGALNKMQLDVAKALSTMSGDVVILSPTGSGKTLAYLLPLVFKLNPESDFLQAVVVVPSRELAKQSVEVLRSMGVPVRGMALYGGRPAMEEHREIRKARPQIVFSTPGRFNDHVAKGNINPKGVRYLVLDEFDKCLEMGFEDEMKSVFMSFPVLERRILLSATRSSEIPLFVNMKDVCNIDYTKPDSGISVSDRISGFVVRSEQKDKLETLSALLKNLGDASTIVFLNYRESVERAAAYLRNQGFVVSVYHGGLEQAEREDNLFMFSNGSANVLVSTDLASRGLDIPDVDNIVHYHLPQGRAEYVHRIGRTARWDAVGRTFILLGPQERLPEYLDADMPEYEFDSSLSLVPTPRMATIYIGKGKKDKISKGDVLGFLCKKCSLSSSQIGRIDIADRYCYVAVARDKVSLVLRLANGERIKGIKTEFELKGN